MAEDEMNASRFQRIVWAHYRKYGRHDLPWRNLPAGRQGRNNPYRILVSEVMLQQTQVERVIPFYKRFVKRFPTTRKLAEAPLSDVLKAWQGLGYNRRAKLLRDAAQELARTPLSATQPNLVKRLEELPGVGPYTAHAVAAFAFNQDVILIETNIRTAIIHHFFGGNTSIYGSISDAQIEKALAKVLPKGRAREWYGALMDYGAHLKRSGVSINARSRHYAKQSKFAGSLREARGALLRAYTRGATSRAKLFNLLGSSRKAQIRTAFDALVAEGLITSQSARE